ncbi:hypothetical protein Tco_0898647 [Tanacetum coccineum]
MYKTTRVLEKKSIITTNEVSTISAEAVEHDEERKARMNPTTNTELEPIAELLYTDTSMNNVYKGYNKESPSNKGNANIENLIIKEVAPEKKLKVKLVLVDDDGNPREKVDYMGNMGSEDKVELVNIETASYLASKPMGLNMAEMWNSPREALDPYSVSPKEKWNQLTLQMKAHYLVGTANQLLSDEHVDIDQGFEGLRLSSFARIFGFIKVGIAKFNLTRFKLQKGLYKVESLSFKVSNDDDGIAQRRLEKKQLEERTNTDCLVKEQEKGDPHGFEVPTLNEDAEYR